MVINMRRRRDRKHQRRYTVLLDGRDVTDDTFYVDSRRGVVRRFLRDSAGAFYVDESGIRAATNQLRGHVRLIRKDAEWAS